MSPPENVFKGDTAQVAAVDIDVPLANAKTQTCEYYSQAYGGAAKEAEEKGETQNAAVYRFLQDLNSFHPSFDTPAQPFAPLMQMEGKRTLLPADLTPADIEVVRALSKQAKDPALRARLHDVLWELTKDHLAGAEAAACYTAAAQQLDADGDWTFAITTFKRAVYLASKFGRSKQLFGTAANALADAARRAKASPDAFHCCQLMGLMLRVGVGDPKEFAALAAELATAAKSSGDLGKAKGYFEVEAEWRKRAGESTAEAEAHIAAGETAVLQAELRAQGAGASFMAAASILSEAIEQLRQAGATKERIAELRKKLNEWQQASLAEFQTFSNEVDISDAVSAARDHVRGVPFPTAVLKLAFGQGLSDPNAVKQNVVEAAKQAPLAFLMGTVMVDRQGRKTAAKTGLFNLKGEAFEEAMEQELFSHASRFHWPMRVDAFIEPARVQILNEHHPTFEHLFPLVRNNPFIPPGHEGIFLRGLHAGFHGDFLVSAHLLTPQIENSLRHVLECAGVDVSNLMSDGTQPVKVLGAILSMPETNSIFGEQMCFELRGCLIEKTGFDFRNRVAHGFVDEGECYSHPAVTVWWLVLRTCLMPMYQTIAKQQPSQEPGPH